MAQSLQKIPKKKFRLIPTLVVVAILAALVIIGYYYMFNSINDQYVKNSVASSVLTATKQNNLEETKEKAITNLQGLEKSGRYGAWPIAENFSSSSDRGNPFEKSVTVK